MQFVGLCNFFWIDGAFDIIIHITQFKVALIQGVSAFTPQRWEDEMCGDI